MTIIKSGYRLTVTSWENDGDHQDTKTMEGFTLEGIKFLIDFIKLFYSRNDYENQGYGNIYDPSDDEVGEFLIACDTVVNKYINENFNDHVIKRYFFDEDGIQYADVEESVSELSSDLGLSGSRWEFYTRVLDSYKVEFIPEDIHIEDVTDQFK